MTMLQIRNRVRDYNDWKAAFDQFDRFRRDNGVRAYRVCRDTEDPDQVEIVLEFDDLEAATAFRTQLLKVWQTPRSQAQLLDHEPPRILDVVEQRTIQPVA